MNSYITGDIAQRRPDDTVAIYYALYRSFRPQTFMITDEYPHVHIRHQPPKFRILQAEKCQTIVEFGRKHADFLHT